MNELITTVRFAAADVRTALAEMRRGGLDELWLIRSDSLIYLTDNRQGRRTYPHAISRLNIELYSEKPQPHVEVLPQHNCVLRQVWRTPAGLLGRLFLDIQFNDLCEFRIFLLDPERLTNRGFGII